jgi:hypothetical protein
MKRLLVALVLCGMTLGMLLVSASHALADEPAMGFWVVGVAELQKAVMEYGSLDKIEDWRMFDIGECQGRFRGKDCDFHVVSHDFSVDFSAKDNGDQLEYRALLGGGKLKRATRDFHGAIKVGPTWSLPDDWKSRKEVIVFKRLNLKN